MKKDELIDKILSDLYLNANRAMDFYDNYCVYENDINKLEEVKVAMDNEGLIMAHKNLKTGITPLGFKICFEGGYLDEKIKRERQIKRSFQRNKREIDFLRRKLKSKSLINTFLFVLLISSIIVIMLMIMGIINLSFSF